MKVGTKVRIAEGSGLDSNKTGVIVPLSEVGTNLSNGRSIPNISGAYKPLGKDERIIKLDLGGYTIMFTNRLLGLKSK